MLVAISIRLREIVALALVLALIAAAFALPPYYADADEPETEPVSAGSARETVLIIDAGHGGEDGGAVTADGVPESGINLGIAKKLEALCGLFGVDSVMTRESQEISYPDTAGTTAQRKSADQKARVELINSQEDAVLVSIHQNFFPGLAALWLSGALRQDGWQPRAGRAGAQHAYRGAVPDEPPRGRTDI